MIRHSEEVRVGDRGRLVFLGFFSQPPSGRKSSKTPVWCGSISQTKFMVLLEPYSDLRGFHFPLLLFSVLFCCLCLSVFCLSYPLRPLLISFLCVSHLFFCRFLQYLSTRHPSRGVSSMRFCCSQWLLYLWLKTLCLFQIRTLEWTKDQKRREK